jgi:DNA-binding transcriptional ArsR family regulator
LHVPEEGFPDEFRRFLERWVPSVDAAELLLVLAREPERRWQPGELAAYLSLMAKVSDADVELYLERFRAAGLIDAVRDGGVRYSTQDERSLAHVRMLSQAYKERPVTLFRAIYARS